MKVFVLLLVLMAQPVTLALGQTKPRKMANNLNHPAINNFAPYISLDGNSLVYITDLGEDPAGGILPGGQTYGYWRRLAPDHLAFAATHLATPAGQ